MQLKDYQVRALNTFGKFLENIYFKKLKTIPVALSPLIQDSISKEYNN